MVSSNERKHTGTNPLRRAILSRFFAAACDLIPADVRVVVDAGCGEGYAAAELLSSRPDIRLYGFDMSHISLQRVEDVTRDMPVFVGDVYNPPLPAKCADLVLSMEVLEHLHEPAEALASYKRLSRRYLLLSVPNEPKFRLMRMLAGYDVLQFGDHPEHVQHWNKRSFSSFVRANGLKLCKVVSPPPFIWTLALCEIEPYGS